MWVTNIYTLSAKERIVSTQAIDLEAVVIFSNACPDCGASLIHYDDYSICEAIEFEDHELVGLVGCGWTEETGPRDLTGISILAPDLKVVDPRALVPEAFETPHGWSEDDLPAGWEPDAFYRHEVVYAGRSEGTYQVSAPSPTDQAALKGEWDDALPEPASRVNVAGFTITVVDPVPLADLRDPDWRYGFGGMYRDAEGAAANVTYVEGEPVVPEQPAITWDSYPWHWDREPELVSGAPVRGPGLDRPRHPRGDDDDGMYLPMWWCGEFQMWSMVLVPGDGTTAVCVECDDYAADGGCPGTYVAVAL